MFVSVRFAGAAVVGALFAPSLAAQRSAPVAPTTYAITGARLVPVSGSAIERGTIVIRGGLIVAVGASVQPPADARVIDGTGLTVYPGLIDASTSLGMPAAAPAGGGQAAAAAAPRPALAPNSSYGTGLQPEILAVAALAPEASMFTAAHAAGFTSAQTAAGSGVFRGQSALINLRADNVADIVVVSPVAQHVGFSRGGGGFGGGGGGGGGGFPGSLMGVMAQLRQQLLDAKRYQELSAAYGRNARGMARPAWNPSLEALQPVLTGSQPVVIFANSEREIIRALDLAKEFGFKVMIGGGSEAYLVAARLKADNVPVLTSINFPRRTAPTGQGARGGGGGPPGVPPGVGGRGGEDDQPETMRVLRSRVEQPKGPGRLAAAGVTVALTSGNNYTDFLANLRRAVAGGMTADQALRALTIEPARLFGAADRLGTLEVGKIANLTVVTGDLFSEGARVSRVFIDGVPIEIPAPTRPTTTSPADSARTP